MEEKITNQKLFIFLVENNAWERFERNILSTGDISKIRKINDGGFPIPQLIDCAFVWERTPEGHNYWEELWRLAIHKMKSEKLEDDEK